MLITTILFTLLVLLWGFSGPLLRTLRDRRPLHEGTRLAGERLKVTHLRTPSTPRRRQPLRPLNTV